ncbi:MAG: DUF429 domain-containing protein [Anaerolineales bacterium]
MINRQTRFMGIAPSIQGESLAFAVIDEHLHPLFVSIDNLERALASAAEQQPKTVGVGAPPNLNHRIVADPDKRADLGLPVKRGRPMDCRVAEYKILLQGVDIYRTPSQMAKAKDWMLTGFKIYTGLKELGFSPYEEKTEKNRWVETPPETCFWLWLQGNLMDADSLEGRIQRQLSLYALGMDIPDPMNFFEEITRYRLLKGILVEEGLYSSAELNAIASAYVAWAVVQRPNEVSFVGDEGEGQIVIPNQAIPAVF